MTSRLLQCDDARAIDALVERPWHNEPDAAFDGLSMGDYFEGFINEEARQLGKTLPEIKAWTPPAAACWSGTCELTLFLITFYHVRLYLPRIDAPA